MLLPSSASGTRLVLTTGEFLSAEGEDWVLEEGEVRQVA